MLHPSAISERSPGADHQPAGLVCDIHQNLGALARLHILICRVADRRIVPDVAEMLQAGGFDIDFAEGRSKQPAEGHGVVVGPSGRAEPRQRESDDVGGGAAEQAAAFGRDQQRKRRIKPARNSDHHRLRLRMLEPLGEPRTLDIEDFPAALPAAGCVLRHKRMTRNRGVRRSRRTRRLRQPDPAETHSLRQRIVVERALREPRRAEPFEIDIGVRQARLPVETAVFRRQAAVVSDDRVSAEHQVGRRLMDSGPGQHISREAAGALLRHQFPAVIGLASQFVACGKVEHRPGPAERQVQRRRQHAQRSSQISTPKRNPAPPSKMRSAPNGTSRPPMHAVASVMPRPEWKCRFS